MDASPFAVTTTSPEVAPDLADCDVDADGDGIRRESNPSNHSSAPPARSHRRISYQWDVARGSVDFPAPAPGLASPSASTSQSARSGATSGDVVVTANGDASILDAVAREVFEETGYRVRHIHALVDVISWAKNRVLAALGTTSALADRLKIVVKYSFLVEIEEKEDLLSLSGEGTTNNGSDTILLLLTGRSSEARAS